MDSITSLGAHFWRIVELNLSVIGCHYTILVFDKSNCILQFSRSIGGTGSVQGGDFTFALELGHSPIPIMVEPSHFLYSTNVALDPHTGLPNLGVTGVLSLPPQWGLRYLFSLCGLGQCFTYDQCEIIRLGWIKKIVMEENSAYSFTQNIEVIYFYLPSDLRGNKIFFVEELAIPSVLLRFLFYSLIK